jgi:hypothetical protein
MNHDPPSLRNNNNKKRLFQALVLVQALAMAVANIRVDRKAGVDDQLG